MVENSAIPATPRRRPGVWSLIVTGAALAAALTIWQLQQRDGSGENPLADVRFVQLTDFDGVEAAAALSRDGRFVAFLSDRDGQMDVWVVSSTT
jgi:hypothetical protein